MVAPAVVLVVEPSLALALALAVVLVLVLELVLVVMLAVVERGRVSRGGGCDPCTQRGFLFCSSPRISASNLVGQ